MKLNSLHGYIFLLIGQVCYCEIDQNTKPIDSELRSQIVNFITKHYLPNAGVNGLGISIVRINESHQALYSNGYGMADHKNGIPNGNQTQFLLASITKSLTSAIVVKILNEKFPEMGEAVLDTPIRTLIPSANFTLIDRFRSEHGTFRDLLAHRMGIVRDDLQFVVDAHNTRSEIVQRQRYAEEIDDIRSAYQYNNQMYVIAGELIGILANKSYETLVDDLLAQIGMFSSALSKKSDGYSNLPTRAKPHYIMDNVSYPTNTDLLERTVNFNAAAGLWSTPDDMIKYLSFHLKLGKVGEKQVIPESVMKWLRTPSNLMPANNFKSPKEDTIINQLSSGLGLMRASYDSWEYLWHDGYLNAFRSQLSLFPSQDLGIFTTSNQSAVLVDQYLNDLKKVSSSSNGRK